MGSHIQSTYVNVFENIHMLWMGRWIHHHPTFTILVGAEFRKLVEFLGCSQLGYK
jgi:hypothetical protein